MPAASSSASRGRAAWACAVAAVLAIVLGYALAPVAETDLFFHLARGREILTTGAILTRNLFSFTYPNHPYPDPAWLFDVAVAALERVGGLPAIVVAKSALVALTFVAAMALARRRGAGPVATAATFAAAAFVMRERFVERPHVVSFAGEVAVLASIAASPRRLAWVVPIAALWANLHAGAFVAAWLLAAAAAGTWLDRTAGDERARPAPLLLAAAGAALACLATPVGWGIARYLAFHVGIAAVHPIDEFRAPDLRSDGALFAFAALAFVAAAPWRGGERVALRDVLPAAALALLAARSVRFGADFALVAAPFVAARATRFAARLGAFARWPAGAAALGVATAAVVVAPRPGRSSFGLAADALPLDAIAFVDREGLRDRLYNDLELGGYLAWQGWPRHRVFVDPRLPAYPDELHRLLGRAEVSRAEWDAALARFGVDRALLAWAGVNRRVAWFDPDRWALVYRERDARVFVRRTAAHRALIAAQEIPATFAFSDAAGVATIPLPEPPAGSPVERCEWRLRLGDLLFDLDDGAPSRAIAAYRAALAIDPACGGPERAAHAHAWVGAMLTNDHQPQTALAHLDRVLSLVDPERAGSSTLANRALALEALGRRGEAARAWALVVRHASDARLASAARGRARELLETE